MLYDVLFFFFKQKTAYEMRISDWSSDVCSSDLVLADAFDHPAPDLLAEVPGLDVFGEDRALGVGLHHLGLVGHLGKDRKSVVWGKSVSVRVDLGGRRVIKKKSSTT